MKLLVGLDLLKRKNKIENLKRTICDCKQCSVYCKIMPGYLVPDDIVNIANNFFFPIYETIESFFEEVFRASPGATIMVNSIIFKIPTIVPSRKKDSDDCYFLEDNGKCSIHEYSPWGCRMADSHMTREEGDIISKIGLAQILNSEGYIKIWNYLNSKNLISKSPEELRKKIQ